MLLLCIFISFFLFSNPLKSIRSNSWLFLLPIRTFPHKHSGWLIVISHINQQACREWMNVGQTTTAECRPWLEGEWQQTQHNNNNDKQQHWRSAEEESIPSFMPVGCCIAPSCLSQSNLNCVPPLPTPNFHFIVCCSHGLLLLGAILAAH